MTTDISLLTAVLFVIGVVLTAVLVVDMIGWHDRRDARRRNRHR